MNHLLTRAVAIAALALAPAPGRALAQPLPVPAPETGAGPLVVPAVPGFELPPPEPGFHNVRELRVRGQGLLGTEITVKGYITWIYDCVKDTARPGEAPAQTQKRIDEDPTLCERPKLYLGATKDASPERSIWVVSVPRPPNKMERQRLPKSELASWPAVPKFALGDHVAVTGTWALQSPHGDRNSDGLLVFKALQPARPSPAAGRAPAPPAPARAAAATPPKVPPAPRQAPIAPAKRQESLRQSNEGAKALGRGDFDAAIREYRASVTTWPENHAAWYYLAYAYTRKPDWGEAAAAAGRAARLAPDAAMYRMLNGLALHERANQRAREAQAAAQGRKPEEIVPDLSAVNQDAALAELVLATHLDDKLWRAHYYCGRIYRDRGEPRLAAESFTNAVRRAPPMAAPYVALSELYRAWDYFDEAIAIARLGSSTIAAPVERADVLYTLGRAHDDKREDAAAVEAYTRALEDRPDLTAALYMRGQVFFRMKKHAAAKADLEAYVAHPAARGWEKAAAQRLLLDLASRKKR